MRHRRRRLRRNRKQRAIYARRLAAFDAAGGVPGLFSRKYAVVWKSVEAIPSFASIAASLRVFDGPLPVPVSVRFPSGRVYSP